MGLKGYIREDTYLGIESVFYYKNIRQTRILAGIYSDDTKQIRMGTVEYAVIGRYYYDRLQGTASCPPDAPRPGDAWLISSDASGEWEGKAHLLAKFSISKDTDPTIISSTGMEGWTYWHINPSQVFYHIADGKYYRFLEDKTTEELPAKENEDIEWWDFWFSSDKVFPADGSSNLWAQAYSYLKQLPGFETTTNN